MMERIIGQCVSNRDPEKRGRIMFRADSVLDGADYPYWAEPVMPPGFFLRPQPGDLVEILMPRLDEIVESPEYVFWTGRLFSNRSPVPAEFAGDPPTKTGYKTPAGHLLIFDDAEGAESITLQHMSGSRLEMRATGEIVAYDGSGEEPLVKKSEFDAHTHSVSVVSVSGVTVGVGVSGPGTGTAAVPTPVVGTALLKGK